MTRPKALIMVGPGRFELPTSRLSGVRSNQLSYGPPTRRCEVTQAVGSKPDRINASAKKEKRRRRCPAILVHIEPFVPRDPIDGMSEDRHLKDLP